MFIHYKSEGTPNSPALVLSNSLGADGTMWDALTPRLLPYFRVIRYTISDVETAAAVPYPVAPQPEIAWFGGAVLALMDHLHLEKAVFCGLSMGGLIGQWLGLQHPERCPRLVLCNTAAKIGTAETWNARIDTIQQQGLSAIVDATMERWFTEAFRQEHPEEVARTHAMFRRSNLALYSLACAAIRDADFRADLGKITPSTLVIAGDEDPVTNVEQAAFLANHIPNAQMAILRARHLSGTENPADFAETLLQFLVGTTPYERGMHIRRTVLGNEHVDKANAQTNDFNADFQAFITHYAWGEIWARPGLPKRDRSLITLAMLIALNRKAEFQMHVKAALNNGLSPDDIKELILQSAIYCGLPAANEAFHTAAEILEEWK